MNLAIYGTGGAGKEVYELFENYKEMREQWDNILFIDDTKPAGVFRGCEMVPFEAFSEKYCPEEVKIVIANGEPKNRMVMAERVREKGYHLATVIHPLAMVSSHAKIGEGVFLQDYVCVSADAEVEDNVFVNGRTIIGHDVHVGENCQISSHVAIGGSSKIGNNVYIGLASAIRDHITVGQGAVISMGAIVMKNVSEERVVMGNPAREIANAEGKVFK